MSKSKILNRRDFLTRCALASAGGVCAYSTLGSLGLVQAAAAQSSSGCSDYKAMVCIFLAGGNDSFNMFVPREQGRYNLYADARRNLSVPRGDLLPVTPVGEGSGSFGFHPRMSGVRDLFRDGDAAIVGNVGALLHPVNRTQYRNESVPVPPRLFSHNDQQDFWATADVPASRPTGWGGRVADLLASGNVNNELSMNITLSGNNLFQTGSPTFPFSISSSGVSKLAQMNPNSSWDREAQRRMTYDLLLQNQDMPLLAREYARAQSGAVERVEEIDAALQNNPAPSVTFPSHYFGQAMQMIAHLIKARCDLNQRRQIYYVTVGGWDHHDRLMSDHPNLLGLLDGGLTAFQNALGQMNLTDNVTTFTLSEFGRTLTSNGDGSDHGWGGHQLVMGGAVRGSRIYGGIPDYVIEGPQDSGRGRLIPTTAVDQYGATLAEWFGISAGESLDVFPNLPNFSNRNLGFMS